MNARLKKTLLFLFKLLVLVLVIEYARRQLQLDDELGALSTSVVFTEDRKSVTLPAGTRLRISSSPAPGLSTGAPRTYPAVGPAGEQIRIPASDVEAASHAFELLPGVRSTLGRVDFSLLGLALLAFGPAILRSLERFRERFSFTRQGSEPERTAPR